MFVARAKTTSYRLNLPVVSKAKIIEVKGQDVVATDNLNVRSIAKSTDSTYGYVSDKYVKYSTDSIEDESSDKNPSTKDNNTNDTTLRTM